MQFSYSKSSLKKVGEKLRHAEPLDQEEEIAFAMYRLGHKNIIEAFRQKHRLLLIKPQWKHRSVIFASRLKKRSTISMKLESRQTQMDLTRMNDIAGCRLIFPVLPALYEYRSIFLKEADKFGRYELRTRNGQYDYIAHPRDTGYRGVHDVYVEANSDPIKAKIEVQYRTAVQHSWATALEIWDFGHGHGAKFGSETEVVQRLFSFIAELFWRYLDSNPSDKRLNVSSRVLYKEILNLNQEVRLIEFFAERKSLVSSKYPYYSRSKSDILLRRFRPNIRLHGPVEEEINVITDPWDDLTEELFDDEKNEYRDSVLVSMDSKLVRSAYNNYFDDASEFKKNMRKALLMAYDDIEGIKRCFVKDPESYIKMLSN